jgi:AcrR family transcriptional regulator
MNKDDLSQERRAYSSKLREEQAEKTRERILESLAELLRAGDIEEISFNAIAKHAGVSVPTVYRYFPNRKALFDGIQDWLSRELKAPPFPRELPEMAEGAEEIFSYYERSRDTFKTAMVTGLFRDIGQSQRQRRDRAVAALVEPLTRHLDERQQNARAAIFRLIYGFEGFSFMSERFGVTVEEMSEAVAWTTRTLLAALEAEQKVKKPNGTMNRNTSRTTKRNGGTRR